MTALVITQTKDRIARIELNRAEKRNALTAEMYQAIAHALRAAGADSQVRVILIHGHPECFCAGNDLKDFLGNPPRGDDSPVFQFLQAVSTAAKPLIAAVGGPAVGIGTTMLLHCDLVYATPEARFQLPFVSLGLVPEAASSFLLPMIAGYQRAAELLLLGKPFDSEKAFAAGLITEVVPKEELLDRARAAAAHLAGLPPHQVQLTKSLMKKRHAMAVQEQMREESLLFRELLGSPEAKEAMSAFLEKRKPDFSRF
ncbi:MAG: enoyl-CoA hydratase [Betaproteobacteria bacterium]|nr:enoyl-CoA hydratase [Betaproteobacteria bacterium]